MWWGMALGGGSGHPGGTDKQIKQHVTSEKFIYVKVIKLYQLEISHVPKYELKRERRISITWGRYGYKPSRQ